MKQFRFYTLLLFVVTVTSSCKKVPVLDRTTAYISFKVDGTAKETKGDKNVFAAYSKDFSMVHIVGNFDAAGDHQISLTINNFHGVGEYATEEDFLGLYNTEEQGASIVGTGRITVTEFIEGKSIKGEFQFKGERMVIPGPGTADVIFTEGKFQSKVRLAGPDDIEID